MSDTAAFAAENASPALTCDFGTGCEPPLGSKIRTTPSQNATRNRNHMTRALLPRGLVCRFGTRP